MEIVDGEQGNGSSVCRQMAYGVRRHGRSSGERRMGADGPAMSFTVASWARREQGDGARGEQGTRRDA
jgi:hypothetical protein